jgi:hypothetical protein
MKIKEVIAEGTKSKTHGVAKHISAEVSDTLPGVYVQKQLRNTDPYMQYRYGLAVAAARASKEVGYSQETDFSENLIQVMYVPEDEETIKLASKLMGVTPTKIADTASHEQKNTGVTSPVATIKKNKYGI